MCRLMNDTHGTHMKAVAYLSCMTGLDKVGSRKRWVHGRDMDLASLFEIQEGNSGLITGNDR